MLFRSTVTGTANAGTFAQSAIGTGITVTANLSGLTLSSTNYTITDVTTPLKADITAKELTITGLAASNKVYDQGTSATPAFTDNRIAGDSLTVSGTANFNNKNVGTAKTVTATGISLSGTDSANYTPNSTATTTANITAKTLAVTITASNKTYDGTTAASVTYADNRIAGDD